MKQYQHHSFKEKLIQIKPISPQKIERENIISSLSSSDEKVTIEKELHEARSELEHLKQEKKKMLQSTIKEINTEKENWEQEKELLIQQGYQEGYELGFAEGKKTVEEQYNALINQANDLVNTATQDYHATLEKSDHVIVDLSIKTAEKITKSKITEDPNSFLKIVTAAIKEIKDQSVISIYLHPNNFETLMKQKSELTNALDGDTKLSIYIDQKMIENDCVIEHPFGKIDASVDTQLQQIQDVLHQITMEKKS